MATAQLSLCDRFGLGTDAARHARLRSFGLVDGEDALGERLQTELVQPRLEALGDGVLDSEYFSSLGQRLDSAQYFEDRLRLGSRLSLDGYSLQEAHSRLIQAQSTLLGTDVDPELAVFITRNMGLDLSLVTESFNMAQVQALWEQANTDELTGLPNRRAVIRSLENALQSRSHVSVLMIDIDYFKQINDEYDHVFGDRVLQVVADRIRAGLRATDFAGRFGGEEFVVVLHDAPLPVATRVAERIRAHVADPPLKIESVHLHTTVSIGVAEAQAGESAMACIRNADVHLYNAKDAGRNCVRPTDGLPRVLSSRRKLLMDASQRTA